jgi:hypothetical protein
VSVVQPAQALSRQIGFWGLAAQSALFSHSAQAPVGRQWPAGAAHSVAAAQARQVPVAVLQTGVVPEQSVLRTQPLHVLVAVSHTGVAPPQCELAVQATQRPAAQAGFAGSRAAHSPSLPQGTQAPLAQIGLAASAHWPEVSQSTQAPLAAHTVRGGTSAAHWAAPVHLLQEAAVQMGAVPEQSASPRQLAHWPLGLSQRGGDPAHWLSSVHWTQSPVAARHWGWLELRARHCPEAVQGSQRPVAVLQIGVVPAQLAAVQWGAPSPPPPASAGASRPASGVPPGSTQSPPTHV